MWVETKDLIKLRSDSSTVQQPEPKTGISEMGALPKIPKVPLYIVVPLAVVGAFLIFKKIKALHARGGFV